MSSADRLSALPIPVLIHILSFLPTQTSVSTSILGRRWRSLWAYVPNLDFYFDDADHTETNLSDIIHRIMLLHKAKNINTFRLYCEDASEYQLETWITTAIERNVRNLDLVLPYMLPRRLFTCKTLVDLCLENCVDFPSCDAIYLPSLKKLCLQYVELEDGEALNRFVSGCPVLENLIVEYVVIVGHYSGCLNISSATIISLVISSGRKSTHDYNELYDYRVKINAPALTYIKVYYAPLDHISLSPITMASLTEADIFLDYNVNQFLDCLYNVKCLKLLCYTGKFLDSVVTGSIVQFDNLTKLKIEYLFGWPSIVKLLEISHNLQVLIVNVILVKWMNPKQPPACLLFHLRIITIHRMQCKESEFNMVKYLLANALELERMDIYFEDGVGTETKFNAVQRISLIERGSKACELALYWDYLLVGSPFFRVIVS